ncbi:hypothetical protein FLX56_24315 [Synechococcus moorigangaii CMS01]|nr:hypothetical protein [Synechococcus moorigangaii CMS01]
MTSAIPADPRFHLAPWLQEAIRPAVPLGGYLRLRVRLRGNTLHLLCETTCPTEKAEITQAIVRELQRQKQPIQLLHPPPPVGIYRLIVYGRLRQAKKSLWLSLINLEQPQVPLPKPQLHLNLKNQARLGEPEAIAQYLSQNLGPLGVGIRVETQTLTNSDSHATNQRLWITCECDYSPDYRLLTEPLVQRLRELQVKNFRDGAIRCQIRGEERPEWSLWVDLTPPEVMLRQWGRWGDPEAIATLLSQTLKLDPLTCQASTDQNTLKLIVWLPPGCQLAQARVTETVREVLAGLAPQGLLQVTLQGKCPNQDQILWETAWPLPAHGQPELQDPPERRAQQGNLAALKFLIQRCLNPHLAERLATGGVHVTLRQKASTLYIMAEAIACPSQTATLQAIAQLFRHLEPHPFTGLKVYGRRSGQSKALWQQSLKFRAAAPPRSEVPSSDAGLENPVMPPPLHPLERLQQIGCSLLKGSKLWQTVPDSSSLVLHRDFPPSPGRFSLPQRGKLVLLGALGGILFTGAVDWLAGQWLHWDLPSPTQVAQSETEPAARSEVLDAQLTYPDQRTTAPKAIAPPIASPYPSFDNPLLDEKLAFYQQRIARNGVPDVLIIGSSRALRGLDPLALQTALVEQGHPPLDIFNFGINGATVQIFDLLLRQVLPPEQLPKLIILADGARAFNSGRPDLTYDLMTRSAGFQALEAGTLPLLLKNQIPKQRPFTALEPADLDQAVSQWLGAFSQIHSQRQLFKERLVANLLSPVRPKTGAIEDGAAVRQDVMFNLDGFLPLDRRFIPETYYQNHTQVTGDYDGDYAAFNLQGVQHETFLELLNYLKAHQVHLVFLNQPLTDHYLDPVRSEYERQFRGYFRQLATQEHLDFVDFVHQKPWQSRYEWFSDPSHLNQFGAAQVAQELATISTIPWPQSP